MSKRVLVFILVLLCGCSYFSVPKSVEKEQSAKACLSVTACTAAIKESVKKQWSKPGGVDRDLHIFLDIELDNKGNLVALAIHKSSGDDVFDKSVFDAVTKSAPFAMLVNLPEEIFKKNYYQFVLKFSLVELKQSD